MKRLLITGVGGSPAVNFIRSVRKINEKIFIVGTDASNYYLSRSEANVSYLSPLSSDKKYLDFLNFIINKHQLELIHIQNDQEIQIISENREKLHIKNFLPSKQTVKICQNKFKTYEIWTENKIKVPKNIFINTVFDLRQAYKKFGNKIWLREMSGAGGKGSLAPKDFNQSKAWIDFNQGWKKFIASELLTDKSVTWMSIWNNGELVVAQGRKRLYWELSKISPSGVTGATGGGMTYSDSKLDKIAVNSIMAIDKKPHGIFSVDLTYDKKGTPNPTEINIGRFFTTHEFFTQAGLNMPEIYLKLALDEKMPTLRKKLNPLRSGLIWIRGMDFLPVLINEKRMKETERNMQKIINKLKK